MVKRPNAEKDSLIRRFCFINGKKNSLLAAVLCHSKHLVFYSKESCFLKRDFVLCWLAADYTLMCLGRFYVNTSIYYLKTFILELLVTFFVCPSPVSCFNFDFRVVCIVWSIIYY